MDSNKVDSNKEYWTPPAPRDSLSMNWRGAKKARKMLASSQKVAEYSPLRVAKGWPSTLRGIAVCSD
jgi:hypothetical protein